MFWLRYLLESNHVFVNVLTLRIVVTAILIVIWLLFATFKHINTQIQIKI